MAVIQKTCILFWHNSPYFLHFMLLLSLFHAKAPILIVVSPSVTSVTLSWKTWLVRVSFLIADIQASRSNDASGTSNPVTKIRRYLNSLFYKNVRVTRSATVLNKIFQIWNNKNKKLKYEIIQGKEKASTLLKYKQLIVFYLKCMLWLSKQWLHQRAPSQQHVPCP